MIQFCSLYSGSSGNALFLKTAQTKILIDAGLSGIKIINALTSIGEDAKTLNAILVTHEHSDHIQGAGILSRKLDIPIYANCKTWTPWVEFWGKLRSKTTKVSGRERIFKSEK